MESMINIGIDLGTTNSAIAKFIKGEITIFNNPTDYGRNTLPSVVGFRKDKIFIGSKAKEYAEKDPKSVIGVFKRKMGTSESFKIKAINDSKTPIELSSIILKELKGFLPPGEAIDAAVITIPASFDTIQSNATKEAGIQAGFKQVILLQEPIAASLAYANMKKQNDLTDGMWLVYDLGGGTFDVALIKIQDGEMKVLDHEGDNFLGGADFDRLMIEEILIPKILSYNAFENLKDEMQSASGKYNAQYYRLLAAAEKAKIDLSLRLSTEIEITGFQDENDNDIDIEITITRSEFNELIKPYIDKTIEMVRTILTRNTLKSNELQFTLMVGGSTFIPYVRQRVEEILQIPVNCEIDPTTAVAVGAAYYAATKPKELTNTSSSKKAEISIRASYQKASKEKEELFSAKVSGQIEGLFYRIIREDGGFDSGLKKLVNRISEDLPLVENAYNFFKLTVYDKQNNVIETDMDMIGINSGFGISGQPLPDDICLEVDNDELNGETVLLMVFQKNSVLPLKRTFTRILNKSVLKGSGDEVIRVNVLEGPHTSMPQANKLIGHINLTGKNISRDVQKGSDIEITLQISESRDLTISAYLNMADQEFKETFNPKVRSTPVDSLKMDIELLSEKLEDEIEEASNNENYETAKALSGLKKEMEEVAETAEELVEDDVTDKRYQLEDKKRKLAQNIDNATKNKRIAAAKTAYFETKGKCLKIITDNGNDYERKHFNDIESQESSFLTSSNAGKIQEKIDELNAISYTILWRTPDFLTAVFRDICQRTSKMNDQVQAKSLVDAGKFAIESQNWDRLAEIDNALINLLPRAAQKEVNTKIGFN